MPAGEPFGWAHFGSRHALYHRLSGQTHFVNDSTLLLLQRCLIDPKDADEAAQLLAGLQDVEPAPELIEGVRRLLPRLEQLGLVERLDSP